MRQPYYESTIHKQIREKRENRKDRIKDDLMLYGNDVLESEEMKQAFQQTHHPHEVAPHDVVLISQAVRPPIV